jgi:hypothetical protein
MLAPIYEYKIIWSQIQEERNLNFHSSETPDFTETVQLLLRLRCDSDRKVRLACIINT